MSTLATSLDAAPLRDAGRPGSLREMCLVAFMLCMAIRTSHALTGEWAPISDLAPLPGSDHLHSSSAPAVPAPRAPESLAAMDFTAPAVIDTATYSDTEFRPRKHTTFDSEAGLPVGRDTPMLHGTTVWQRLSDYRSHGRVRLLTLWETAGSTVSIQAGKGGNPTLQWTSRLMARGEATRGLLDRLWSVSLNGAGETFRNTVARSGGAQTPSKLTSAPAAVQPIH